MVDSNETLCPCVTENVSDWPHKRPSTWTDAERTHVRYLVKGGATVRHREDVPCTPESGDE